MGDVRNVLDLDGNGDATLVREAFEAPGANTSVKLFYRCAANYKSVSEEVLAGRIEEETLRKILDNQFDPVGDGPSILPQNLGLTHPMLSHGLAYDDGQDHASASILEVRYTDEAPTSEIDAAVFAAKVDHVLEHGWDEPAAMAQMDPDVASFTAVVRPGP